jgi:uncharacterized membrane protein (DUF106 family)
MNKEGSFIPVFVVMFISLLIAFTWDKIPIISNTMHLILDPTIGVLLNWNITFGMVVVIFMISIIMTLAQKYATDQETIREIKAEQKKLQKEMDEFKEDLEKRKEIMAKIMPLTLDLMKHSMRPVAYTGIPIILFFRWFHDYFSQIPDVGFGFIYLGQLYLVVF